MSNTAGWVMWCLLAGVGATQAEPEALASPRILWGSDTVPDQTWRGNGHVRHTAGQVRNVTETVVLVLPAGGMAAMDFDAAQWQGYRQLWLELEAGAIGDLVLQLDLGSGATKRSWSALRKIPAGHITITLDLAPAPEGDLHPSPLSTGSPDWNPQPGQPVTLTIVGAPGHSRVFGLELRNPETEQ